MRARNIVYYTSTRSLLQYPRVPRRSHAASLVPIIGKLGADNWYVPIIGDLRYGPRFSFRPRVYTAASSTE